MGLRMKLGPDSATEPAPLDMARKVSAPPDSGRVSPLAILLVAVWLGLIVGFVDAVAVVIHRRWVEEDFLRLGGDFGWLIPVGVTVLALVPAIVLAVVSRMRGKGLRMGTVGGLLSFVGFLDICARLPIEAWASLLLSSGLAVQTARLVNRRSAGFLTLVRRTVPIPVGLLLAVLLVTLGGRAWEEHRLTAALPAAPLDAPNVLLIVWDTVRFGNLSLNGYGRPTTPNLQRLARRGVRFDQAYSTASWTLPAHASLFTGWWPHELGVNWKSPMRDDVPTLAGFLAGVGYDTAGFAANVEYCNRETGLSRGFAHFEDYPIDLYDVFTRYVALTERIDLADCVAILNGLLLRMRGGWFDLAPRSTEHVKSAEAVDRAFLAWLSRRSGGRPFFAFLNYNDAHTPYEVPDRSSPAFGLRPASPWDRLTLHQWMTRDKSTLSYRDVRMAADNYDDCIAYLDRRLGILLEDLEKRGVLDNTLVVVASDHGEHLGDHMLFFHGCSLYRQLVQVSLVIVDPREAPAGRVVSRLVSLRDIPATVADLLGLGQASPFPGRSLARLWRPAQGQDIPPDEPLLMETTRPLLLANGGREPAARGTMRSMIAGGLHYIRTGDGLEELYDLGSDPAEQTDLAGLPMAGDMLNQFRNRLAVMLRKK